MIPVWGYGGGIRQPSKFEEQYHCFSAAYADRGHLEQGDKILLPPSAFDTLARLNVDYPMLFQLQSGDKGTMTHCGVLEFTAEEGSCYIPFWMMQNLLITEGSLISVTNVSLPKATFVKLQPQHVDFLEISNPRAVLEHALRNFSCVTRGDVICVPYNNKNYHFELKEVKPKDAACIIETDCNVDFDAPVGYKEPTREQVGGSSSSIQGKLSNDDPKPLSTWNGEGSGTSSSQKKEEGEDKEPKGIRVVDGAIVRPDDDEDALRTKTASVAERLGGTGVQRNSAIPVLAPEADYWAVHAGSGARLDGKEPSKLKDKKGKEIDALRLRAEAAQARAKAQAQEEEERARKFPSGQGITTAKSSTSASMKTNEDASTTSAAVLKRKSRIGNKYSQRKGIGSRSAFGGEGNRF